MTHAPPDDHRTTASPLKGQALSPQEARLAKALRDNLARRKAQQRAQTKLDIKKDTQQTLIDSGQT